jgi:hypothetical protein
MSKFAASPPLLASSGGALDPPAAPAAPYSRSKQPGPRALADSDPESRAVRVLKRGVEIVVALEWAIVSMAIAQRFNAGLLLGGRGAEQISQQRVCISNPRLPMRAARAKVSARPKLCSRSNLR